MQGIQCLTTCYSYFSVDHIVNLAFHFLECPAMHVATVPAALQWCTQNKDEENLFGYSLSIVQFDYKMVASRAHYN